MSWQNALLAQSKSEKTPAWPIEPLARTSLATISPSHPELGACPKWPSGLDGILSGTRRHSRVCRPLSAFGELVGQRIAGSKRNGMWPSLRDGLYRLSRHETIWKIEGCYEG